MTEQPQTSYEELQTFLSLLPHPPILIPIVANDKKPDIPEGESWKDSKFYLTPEQAIQRLKEGRNVGIVAHDWLVIVDLDNPEKYELPIETVTVLTRNGALHKHFLNSGNVKNAVGKNTLAKCGEVRAEWQYVLAPGSYVPKDVDAHPGATGLYHVVKKGPIATLHSEDLPKDFIPTEESQTVNKEVLTKPVSTRNKYGWSLEDIRKRDQKLDELLNGKNPDLPSDSEGDMSALAKLLFWEFEEHEAVTILKQYRSRSKLERGDYILGMLKKITIKEKMSDRVNPKKWDPSKGNIPKNLFNTEGPSKFWFFNENNKVVIDYEAILNELNDLFTFKTPTDLEDIYYYDNGVYKNAEHMIKGLVETWLGEHGTTYIINEVLGHIQRKSYCDRSEFNKYQGLVPVQNGLLDLKTLKLQSFDKNQVFTYKLNTAYNADAECPIWEKFVLEILNREDIPLLQEWMGYCLLPTMPKNKMMWFYGTGRNGKGRVIATLEAIFGLENCAALELSEFDGEHRFALPQLYGKMINVSSEPTTQKELQTALLKKITGEDTLDAEVKNKQRRLKFKNTAKPIVLGNKFPKVPDTTVAFWDRVLAIKFPNAFIGKNQIDNIERKWLGDPQELSGILNWMLTGLHALLCQNDFSKSKTTEETTIEFKRISDTIGAWLQEKTQINPEKYTIRTEAFEHYKTYCDDIEAAPETKTKFTQRLKDTPRIRDSSVRENDKKERAWLNLELLPNPNDTGTDGTLGTAKRDSIVEKKNNCIEKELSNGVPSVPSVVFSPKRNDDKLEEALGHIPIKECSICLKPLPDDLFDTTFYQGHAVHCVCVARLKGDSNG